jgi:prepilin-type processing-associated H-X9-DG protein
MMNRNSKKGIRDNTDGTSNTHLLGERPVPSDLGWGWWTGPGASNWCALGIPDVALASNDYFGIAGLKPGGPNDPYPIQHWWSYHPSGAHFLYVDGHVNFLGYSTDHRVIMALSTIRGNEVVSEY